MTSWRKKSILYSLITWSANSYVFVWYILIEKYYKLSIKAELLKLEKLYQLAKEEFGVAGGNWYYKEEICDKGLV